jgi:hypothetical protein
MRERGLRPVQVWVPDVRTPEFVAAADRQASAVAAADEHDDTQAWIEGVAAPWGEE